MRRLPPRMVRRAITVPAVLLATSTAITSMPVWATVAAGASRIVPGRWRPLRLLWFVLVYLFFETATLAALLGLWLAAGRGRRLGTTQMQAAHYRLMGWWLRRIVRSAERTFRLDVVAVDGRNEGPAPGRPAIVACRHAGPGDSMLLVDGLVNDHRRRPRIVLKDLLQLDPCFDVMLNRVPTVFVPSSGPERDQVEAAIAQLASDLGPEDALVIFPEGTNATASRKRRIIDRFRRAGRHDLATKADALAHTLPPRTSGLFAAIDAAPHADVVFMVHTGLEHLNSLGDVWRGLPMDSRVLLGWWRVDAADVPGDHADRERWLYDEWQRLDDWVAQRQG